MEWSFNFRGMEWSFNFRGMEWSFNFRLNDKNVDLFLTDIFYSNILYCNSFFLKGELNVPRCTHLKPISMTIANNLYNVTLQRSVVFNSCR